MLITRQKLVQMLQDWQHNRISRTDLREWANSIYFPGKVEFDDWEARHKNVS